MSIPTPWTVGVRRHVEGAVDRYGNVGESWGPVEPWPVHGWSTASAEPWTASRPNLLEVDLVLYAPPTADAPTARDVVVIDGAEYRVEGEPQDWTRGPWPHPSAGLVYALKRTEG